MIDQHSKLQAQKLSRNKPLKRILRKKKYIILITALGLILSSILASLLGKDYTASALLSLSTDEIPQVIIGLNAPHLALEIMQDFKLQDDPQFNTPQSKPSQNQNDDLKSKNTFKALSVNEENLKTLSQHAIDNPKNEIVSRVLDHFSAKQQGNSPTVQLRFTSNNPKKSADIVNAWADKYVALNQKDNPVKDNQIDLSAIREEISRAREQAQKYRAQKLPQISTLKAQLIKAQEDKKALESKLADQKKTDARNLQNLQTEHNETQEQITQLSIRYGPKHPKMIEKQTALRALESQINAYKNKTSDSLIAQLNDAKSRINQLSENIENTAQTQTMITELEAQTERNEAVFEKLSQIYKDQTHTNAATPLKVEIQSYAKPPANITHQKAMIIALATLTSFICGLIIAYIADKNDKRLRSKDDFERLTTYAPIVTIPHTPNLNKFDLLKYLHDNPTSQLNQSIREIFLLLEASKTPAKVLSLVSSNDQDGKTTLCILLASLMAKCARNVVLIDANLHHPTLVQKLGLNPYATLVEYLTGHQNLESVLMRNQSTGYDIITAQAVPNSAFDILNTKKMKALIYGLREQYDYVIINTASSETMAEAKSISRFSDQTFFIANAKTATAKSFEKAINAFQNDPQTAWNIILNFAKIEH